MTDLLSTIDGLLIDIDGAGHDLAPAKYDAAQRTLDAAVSLFESLPADRPGVVPLFDPSRLSGVLT